MNQECFKGKKNYFNLYINICPKSALIVSHGEHILIKLAIPLNQNNKLCQYKLKTQYTYRIPRKILEIYLPKIGCLFSSNS